MCVQVADKRIAQLQISLETADGEKEDLEQAIQGLRQQVTHAPTDTQTHTNLSLGREQGGGDREAEWYVERRETT